MEDKEHLRELTCPAYVNPSGERESADWGEVTPTALDEAKEQDQASRWFDHRRYLESVNE